MSLTSHSNATPALPLTALTIWADESCLNNQAVGTPRLGACAGIVIDLNGHQFSYAQAEADTTNNRMALLSAILPLRHVPATVPVTFYSDSQYLVNGITEWIHTWKAKGWRTSKGPVENQALWEELYHLVHELQRAIVFLWVKGHANVAENVLADQKAVEAARTQRSYNELDRPEFQLLFGTPEEATPVPPQNPGATQTLSPSAALEEILHLASPETRGDPDQRLRRIHEIARLSTLTGKTA